MKEPIKRKDRNGNQLFEGDIVAETTVGQVIWNGDAIVISRPLGIVVTCGSFKSRVHDSAMFEPEETDRYNINQIRKGLVEVTDKAEDWVSMYEIEGHKYAELFLSCYDGNFYAWEDLERIGSVYDDLDI